MSNPNFTPMNEEQREAVRLKRIADQEWAGENLKDDFADEAVWRNLASDKNIRMPQRHIPGTDLKHMKRACKKLNIEISSFLESTGFSTLKQFANANVKWPSWALVGLILEYNSDNETHDYKYLDKIDS